MRKRLRSPLVWFALSLVLILADQLTKYYFATHFELGQVQAVIPSFNLVLAHNYGAAFSLLDIPGGAQHWFFVGVSAIISFVLIVWLTKTPHTQRLQSIALALILGGAVGNLIDRLFYGYVVDFIDIYVGGWHWPAFNLADSAVCVGAALLMWAWLRAPSPCPSQKT